MHHVVRSVSSRSMNGAASVWCRHTERHQWSGAGERNGVCYSESAVTRDVRGGRSLRLTFVGRWFDKTKAIVRTLVNACSEELSVHDNTGRAGDNEADYGKEGIRNDDSSIVTCGQGDVVRDQVTCLVVDETSERDKWSDFGTGNVPVYGLSVAETLQKWRKGHAMPLGLTTDMLPWHDGRRWHTATPSGECSVVKGKQQLVDVCVAIGGDGTLNVCSRIWSDDLKPPVVLPVFRVRYLSVQSLHDSSLV